MEGDIVGSREDPILGESPDGVQLWLCCGR